MSLITKAEYQQEKAVLIGLIHQGQKEEQVTEYLDELAFLAETAGAVTLKRFTQRLQAPHPRTFIGEGKLEEIRQYVAEKEVDLAIFCYIDGAAVGVKGGSRQIGVSACALQIDMNAIGIAAVL